MILITKHNVTVALLESICSDDGEPFLLQTPVGIMQFRLTPTTNSHGNHKHKLGMLVLRAQNAYLLFDNDRDTLLHGTSEELVNYIKKANYYIELAEGQYDW